jgi:hypothetical protein
MYEWQQQDCYSRDSRLSLGRSPIHWVLHRWRDCPSKRVVGRTQFDQVELTGTASRTVKPSGRDFQYNPPYTIPVLRRNEIAVPVASEYDNVKDEWTFGVRGAASDGLIDDDEVAHHAFVASAFTLQSRQFHSTRHAGIREGVVPFV